MATNSHENSPWYLKVQTIPKPVIYVVLVIALLIPLFRPLKLPLALSPNTRKAFDLIDSLPEGSYVFHSIAMLPATDAELWPQMVALSRHYMAKGLKVIYWSYTQEGFMYADKIRTEVAPEYDGEYGKDFVILPFKAGQESAVMALKDFYGLFSADAYGTSLGELDLLKSFKGMADLSLIVINTGSDDLTYFVRHIEPIANTPLVAAGTAPVLPYATPYLGSGQIKGAIIGVSGAAEFESLAQIPGVATSAMDAQQMGHVFIVAMVILGNVGYLFQRKASGGRKSGGGSRG